MGEQSSPSDSTTFLVPYITITGPDIWLAGGSVHSLPDWMGITLNGNQVNDIKVNALPFRAYVMIWNEWFRDQDLQDPFPVPTGDGPDTFDSYDGPDPLYHPIYGLQRGKRHDYFTSARPWPGKPMNIDSFGMGSPFGFNNMQLPTAGVPVKGLGVASGASSQPTGGDIKYSGGRVYDSGVSFSTNLDTFFMDTTGGAGDYPLVRVLVNDIRMSVMIQGMLERNARGGTRYAELVRSHFGVISPDARLQRPELLGTGRAFITVNPVAQTSATGIAGTTTVLGELAGVGTAVANKHGFSQSFTEHGTILGLVCVRGDLTYQNGIHRMWFRRTQFDFYWPALAHLGEQAIYSREIYADGANEDASAIGDASVFGYQERWAEYKHKPNRISGLFRSARSEPLDMWHLSQNFSSRPVLNNAFIVENPPVDRVLQVDTTSTAQFLFDSVFSVRMVRAMPMFSLPGLGPRL